MLITLGIPLSASAAPPSSVVGIRAELADGKIRVAWDPLPGEDIAYFRVYYSRRSILGNGGEYDDFEVTAGNRTEYTLAAFPPGDRLFLSVLAVNATGEESTYFAEEAQVDLSGATGEIAPAASSAANVAPEREEPATSTLRIVSASALSATGVLVIFSEPVTVAATDAVGAFGVEDASGTLLTLRRLVFRGNEVTIVTGPQEPSEPYTVRVAPSVRGKTLDADGNVALIDPAESTAFFSGWSAELPATGGSPDVSAGTATAPADPTDLRLRAEPQDDGTYAVTAEWVVASGAESIEVLQSTDGGATYAPAQTLPGSAGTVRFAGVPPGMFTLLVRSVGANGESSYGVNDSIELPSISPPEGPLNESGPLALLAFMGAGGTIGLWRAWRKKSGAC